MTAQMVHRRHNAGYAVAAAYMCCFAIVVGATQAQGKPQYIGIHLTGFTFATTINSSGTVAGDLESGSPRAFVRAADGTVTGFDAPGGGTTIVVGINDDGDIVGSNYYGTDYHGFMRWADGSFSTFDGPGAEGTFVTGVNKNATAVGYYSTDRNGGPVHGFIRSADGSMVTFDAPIAISGTYARSINGKEAVAGDYGDRNDVSHGFLRRPDATFENFGARDAGGHAGQGTFSSGINASGAITGFYVDGFGVYHGFLRQPGGRLVEFDATDAGKDTAEGTFPSALNKQGKITGYYFDADRVQHGFLRAADGTITEFDYPNDRVRGTQPMGINNSGAIVGIFEKYNRDWGFIRIP